MQKVIRSPFTDKQQTNWNLFYEEHPDLNHENWLGKYSESLIRGESQSVLDIGCGTGLHIPYYLDQGWDITALDYSESAIEVVKANHPRIAADIWDIRNDLPYGDHRFSLVVADLSLHYFSRNVTGQILGNIKRVMMKGGLILIRLNSHRDVNFGSGGGKEIEPGFFENQGSYKRFFTDEMVREFLSPPFKIEHMEELSTLRYKSEKWVWEIVAANLNP